MTSVSTSTFTTLSGMGTVELLRKDAREPSVRGAPRADVYDPVSVPLPLALLGR